MRLASITILITAMLLFTPLAIAEENENVSVNDENTGNDTSECDAIIGIDSSGVAFDKLKVNVMVGDTVCWIWENESMTHNVAQVESETAKKYMEGGIYSGEAETTVDFRHTFTEDETFYYVCEPHAEMDMRGVVKVGIGTVEIPEDSNSTPGFGVGITMIALAVGLMFTRKRNIEV
ncbi:MAG: hypothetical protein CMB64_06190 [Euryarchaeota archaeon]|nr:hypothetical protein [Euryarchaeota archaeon]|tara:strand:- start:85 stop:615 length:531 start_codon:yes stop_codon:yes gene_type:complete